MGQSADCNGSGHYKQRTYLIFDLSVFNEARHEVYTGPLHIHKKYTLNLNILFQIEIKQKINTLCLEIQIKIKGKGNTYLYYQFLHQQK